MTDYNDTPEKDSGTSRRAFLGAAAAAASLTAITGVSTATQRTTPVETYRGEYGTHRADLPKRDSRGTFIELWNPDDRESELQAKAYHHDDGESRVTLGIEVDSAAIDTGLTPGQARDLARDLRTAADHAEYGTEQ